MALNPNRLVLKKNPEGDEWVVKVYLDGKYSDEHSYYTDDKADAEATMESMQKWLDKQLEVTGVPGEKNYKPPLGSFGAILSGGDQLIFDASDFTSVKLANPKVKSPRPMVSRVILTPLRSSPLGLRDSVALEARMKFRGYESDQTESTPVTWLRSGRIMIDFYMRGPMKRAVCTLTKEANAQLQVWLDTMEEQGKIKS